MNSTRYFINVGKRDGYSWTSLKDFLRECLQMGRDDIFKVDVMDSFSFFNTETSDMPKVLEFFTDFKHNGRFVNVEVSEDKGRERNRSRGKSKGKRKENNSIFFDGPKREKRSEKRGSQDKRKSKSGVERPRRSRR